MKIDEIKKKIPKIFFDKKFQWGLTAVLFLIILAVGVNIRYQPISNGNLIDPTTGDYTPLALDPYYFLRVSETLIENGGELPEFDQMRSPHLDVVWNMELLPKSTVLIFNILKTFNQEVTLNFADVLNPVVFFALGLIVFFILSYLLTKSKIVAISASFILTVIPPYLYRTLAGFTDHESIGMFGFFTALTLFALGMFYLDKKSISKYKVAIWGVLSGIGTVLSIVTWGGIGKFLFMIFPLAFITKWLTKEDKKSIEYLLFYCTWFVGIVFGSFIFGYSFFGIVKSNILLPSGVLTFLVLGYAAVELILTKLKLLPKNIEKYKEVISIASVIVIGALFYQIFIGNVFDFLSAIILKVLNPFSGSRLAQTVAEQKATSVTDLISQVGAAIFYIFVAGCVIVGIKISNGIRKKKLRLAFASSFAFFVFGILFSKISDSSILNGNNFLSKTLFFISFLTLAVASVFTYMKSKWHIETRWIFIFAWMVPMLLAVRSAIRVFFAIVPFISLMVSITILDMYKYSRKTKESIVKVLTIAVVLVCIIAVTIASSQYYSSVSAQAKAQTPSYNTNWQNAMDWVRNNTEEGEIFSHWWDYGYWVQTGGDRPTFSDGGHSQGSLGNHIFGRYVLTTPNPNTAKSFFKTNNISYLLIDPTDIGKYSAYSSIGTGNEIDDRTSYIPTLISNPSEIRETNNGTIRVYQGGFMLDDDIVYSSSGSNVLLPKGKAGLGAVILEKQLFNSSDQAKATFKQPEGIYVYNGQQYRIPIRKMSISGQLVDFGSGVDATVYVYPNVFKSGAGQQFDQEGAMFYFSNRVQNSLVAQLYVMGDPNNEYPELELVHSESLYPFEFYYGGYNGAIKIYKINTDEMDNIITHEEFKLKTGEYGLIDDMEFVKK